MNLTAEDIRTRFVSEQSYIQRYIDFLQITSKVDYFKLKEIADALDDFGIEIHDSLPKNVAPRRVSCTPLELEIFVTAFKKVLPEVEAKIETLNENLKSHPEPEGLKNVDVRSAMGEWIDFCMYNLRGRRFDPTKEFADELKERIQEQDGVLYEMHKADGYQYDGITPEEADYCIRAVLFLCLIRPLNALWSLLGQYKDLELYHRFVHSEAEINTLRQGFILVMTAFDAAIFDLMRVALAKDFFKLIPIFGSKKSLALDTLGAFGGFSEFQEFVVEEQLKSKYLKDLLFILDKLGVECVETSQGERFVELIEMVMRRNIHVHNRGFVDERYLERRNDGTPTYNFYNFSPGDVAQIDSKYWELANRLCNHCIKNVAAWVNSLDATVV